ncbi:hypothetical protein CP533_2753 [Ophiocordyceps camponoti-saundersi (nom. inval.)]|nr:hypothetical protein CP533_2753 [Ophiocordyceps camponoti-saundersi (nom. inval.)]
MNGSAALRHIDAVDAFSRTLFLRAQQHRAPPLSDIPPAVHQLHIALRHLRIEAADPDSLLNQGPDQASLAPRVQPLVRECEASLKQLECLLDKCDASSDSQVDALDERAAAVRVRLDNDTATVDMLLDSVQLPSASDRIVTGPDPELIKDKVDAIAARIFTRHADAQVDEDLLWREFKSELEKEGFSPQVLQHHKEVLRAYIRELHHTSSRTGGAPPSVRGLLEKHQVTGPPVPPKENFRSPAHDALHLSRVAPPENLSFSSTDGANEMTESMALISTKDLVTTNSIQPGMAALHLQPETQHLSSTPRSAHGRLTSGDLPSPASATRAESWANPSPLGTSPSYAHNPYLQNPHGPSPTPTSWRLAPDRYGKDIPMDAQWTKIRRSLVSPEVLERAGVRYEARPDFVAILGCLSRAQIIEFAEESAKCRAARSRGYMSERQQDKHQPPSRSDSKSSRDDEDEDDASDLWDESDSTDYDDDKTSARGEKGYPYIVSPPSKEKTSPASTVMPKSILKNKNENHVRFDPEPQEFEPKSPRHGKDDRERTGGYAPRRQRDYRDREGSGRSRDGNGREGDRYGSSRHYGLDDDHRRPHRGGSDRDRRGPRRDDRGQRKKAWGETLGVVGIGGAAASLLGVLTEAAIGM